MIIVIHKAKKSTYEEMGTFCMEIHVVLSRSAYCTPRTERSNMACLPPWLVSKKAVSEGLNLNFFSYWLDLNGVCDNHSTFINKQDNSGYEMDKCGSPQYDSGTKSWNNSKDNTNA